VILRFQAVGADLPARPPVAGLRGSDLMRIHWMQAMENQLLKDYDGKSQKYFAFAVLLFAVFSACSPRVRWLTHVYFVFIALPGLFWLIGRREKVLPRSYEEWAWMLFLGWIAIQNSFLAAAADVRYIRYALYVAVFIMVVSHFASPCVFRSETFARRGFWALIAFSLFSFVVDWSNGVWHPGGRIFFLQPGTSPYFHAYLLTLLFSLLLPRQLLSGRWIEFLCVLGALVFVNIVCFASRSAFLGMVVVLLVNFVFAMRHYPKNALRYAGILAFLTVSVIVFYQELTILHGLIERADSHRIEIWNEHWKNFWQYDGLHFGLGQTYTRSLLPDDNGLIRPHNLFLSILVYHGVWALLLFLMLCALTLYRAWRNRDPWGCASLAGLVEAAFMSENIVGYPNAIWFTVLLPMALVLNTNLPGDASKQDRIMPLLSETGKL
jgi:hypothetical protein